MINFKKEFFPLSLFIIGLAVGCSNSSTVDRAPSSGSIPGPQPMFDESWTAQDDKNTQEVLRLMRDKLVQDTGKDPVMLRDAHPKHHGCVKANVSIDPAKLPVTQQVGLFAKKSDYQGLIRFSNGSPNSKQPDGTNDVRGFALKVMGVPYASYLQNVGLESGNPVHDFVFMNSPVFFNESSEDYVKLISASQGSFLRLGWFALTHPRALAILLKASSQKVGNPLDPDYHSAVPYRLGDHSMRMKIASCKANKDAKPKKPHADFLGHKLAEYLAKNEGCFDFYLQVNNDPKKNKVEKAMSAWKTDKSPYVWVGKITVPVQADVRSEKRQEFCENVSFNPWRAPEENRPLGAVNRIRLEVYTRQAEFRHDHNKVADPLPQSFNDIP